MAKAGLAITFYIILFTICGLSTGFLVHRPNHTPVPELEEYRVKIQKISKNRLGNNDIRMNFRGPAPLGKNTVLIGRCVFNLATLNYEVDIVDSTWYIKNEKRRLMLVAHEFIHCQCTFYFHEDSKLKDGCPSSIMSSLEPSYRCVEKHWSIYKNQIKNGCNLIGD